MFAGRFDHSTDGQFRVQVPAKWRPKGSKDETYYLQLRNHATAGMHLRVLPQAEMFRLSNELSRKGETDEQQDDIKRAVASEMTSVELDGSGKITLPEDMATLAGIGKNQVLKLTGAFAYFEIWNVGDHAKVQVADAPLKYGGGKKTVAVEPAN